MSPAELEQLLDRYVRERNPARAVELREQLLAVFLHLGNEVGTLRLQLLAARSALRAAGLPEPALKEVDRGQG